MSVVALVSLISLHATTALVAAGLTVSSLTATVTGATNATPIVVTTAAPHSLNEGAHVVITGVAGNTAANNLDADGVTHNAWYASAVDATRIALYSVDGATGALVPSVGSGAYTSGGTLNVAFTDQRILLGRQHSSELSYPPRILFIPTSSEFGPRSISSASRVSGAPSAEQRTQVQQRSIATDTKTFQVQVWGAAATPAPDADFDSTEVLYQQIVRSAALLLPGIHTVGGGEWVDQTATESQLIKAGHLFVFSLAIATPVTDRVLLYVPALTVPAPTTRMDPNDGSTPEVGCTG